jgi:hypothetical protein
MLRGFLKTPSKSRYRRWKMSQNAHILPICSAFETFFAWLSGLIQSFQKGSRAVSLPVVQDQATGVAGADPGVARTVCLWGHHPLTAGKTIFHRVLHQMTDHISHLRERPNRVNIKNTKKYFMLYILRIHVFYE